MGEITFSFRVDAELKSAFDAAAQSHHVSADELLRDLMRKAVERENAAQVHDEWFRGAVEEAIRDADDPGAVWISHENAMTRLEARIAELKRRASGNAA